MNPTNRFGLRAMRLNVAGGNESSIAIGEIHRSRYADEKRVLACARVGIITGVYRVAVTRFLVHLGIAFEGHAVAGEGHRRHASVRAVHIDAAARSAIVVIRQRRIGLIAVCDEPEVGGQSGRLRRHPAASRHLVGSWRWWWTSSASASRDDARNRRQLVSEIRTNLPAAGGVVSPIVRTDLRVDQVVVREGDVRAVLWVKSDLEQVGEAAIRSAAQPAGRNRSPVDDVIADLTLREAGCCIVGVNTLGIIYVPLGPPLHAGCAASTGRSLCCWMSRLQKSAVVGIAGSIIAKPYDTHVAIGVGSHPREHVRVALRNTRVHLDWRCPSGALIGGGREVDLGVVRPDGVDKSKVIRGKGWEKIQSALIGGTHRAGEDLEIGEGEDWQAHLYVGRDTDVDAPERSTRKVFCDTVGGYEDRVEVSAAVCALGAAVHLDLSRDVRAVARRYAARGRESLRIDSLAKAIDVGLTAVVRALHVDIEGADIMIVQVDVLPARAVDPLAVVAWDKRDDGIRRAKGIAAVSRMGARDAGRQRQTHKRQVRGAARRVVHGNINVAASKTESQGVKTIVGAAVRQNSAVVRLAFVFERVGAARTGRAVRRGEVAVQIDATRYAADAAHVHGPIRSHPNTWLEAAHDERDRRRPNRGERRQRQFLVRAETIDSSRRCG